MSNLGDKDLLILAASVASIDLQWTSPYVAFGDFCQVPSWDPLRNDAEAFRLAVEFNISTKRGEIYVSNTYCVGIEASTYKGSFYTFFVEAENDDYLAATRRAIVELVASLDGVL